jgi:hypothetical protein
LASYNQISPRPAGVWAIDPLVDDRWPDLTASHPRASVFHTRGWIAALRANYGYQPVAFTTSRPDEPLSNALLFCKVCSWLTGSRLVSLPFSDHCEPLVKSQQEFERLCAYADSYRAERDWKYVEMRSANSSLDFGAHFACATTYHLHRLDLRPSLDALRKNFHHDCIQRKIQRAEREALGYESGRSSRLVQQLYGLLQVTRFRHHLPPQPLEWFQQLVANMGKDACIRIASKDGRPIAGILTLDHRNTTYYKYGGSDERFHSLGAIPLLLWRTIQESKDHTAEVLDLGRCDLDNPGLIAFKERWSALRSTLTTWRGPLKVTSALAERRKVLLTRKVCAHLPDAVLELAGRLLYRHIG